MKKNISNFIFLYLFGFFIFSCTHEEYVDVDYPEQVLYIPASNLGEDGVYLINDVSLPNFSEEIPGNSYRFKIDSENNRMILPLSIYRSGINDIGKVKVDFSVNNDTIDRLVNLGKLDVEIIPSEKYQLDESVIIDDGKNNAIFNLSIDLKYLEDNSPNKKMALAIEAKTDERKLSNNYVIIVIDTKIMQPVVDFTFSVDPGNWKRVLFNSTAKYAYSTSWYFGEGDASSDLPNPAFEYSGVGTYNVVYKALGVTGKEVVIEKVVSVTNIVKLLKNNWSILAASSEALNEVAPNGMAKALIDDDLSTFWHSRWEAPAAKYPHWVAVDMGKEYVIHKFICFRRPNNDGAQTKNRFWTSNDGQNWEDQGEYPFNPFIDGGQEYEMENLPKARYFKYEATQGQFDWAFLAEIDVIGEIE